MTSENTGRNGSDAMLPMLTPATDAKGAGGANVSAEADGSIRVEDLGSHRTIHVQGDILTIEGGPIEITPEMRTLLVATSGGQILFSRSHHHNPRVLSQISRIEAVGAKQNLKFERMPIDMSTIREIYEIFRRRTHKVDLRQKDQSRMHRDLIELVADAAKRNGSDIHIIVNQDKARVRFRLDGVMRDIKELPPAYAYELLAAAFTMADASDATYQPLAYQGARISSIRTELPAGVQSLRLQFNPLANEGRYLIIRLLYAGGSNTKTLETLGYNPKQIHHLATMCARPVGINIISGPTGSGKSTTLKALLERVIKTRSGEVNTLTIEDPPEYVIADAQQMPVTNAKTQEERAEAFTKAIAAGLRSDPDIMMIGEIRDKASADLAVEGALSGHPIYASLHANTAMDILSRLRDMGIEDYKVFDPTVFSGLVGQRLIRRLCPHCRVPHHVAHATGDIDPLAYGRIADMFAVTPESHRHLDVFVAGPGCPHCSNGYLGRAVLAEVIIPDDDFMGYMRANQKREARSYWFERQKGLDMLGAGWIRALRGEASPIDIENTAALLAPLPAHAEAFADWIEGEVPL